MNISYRTVGDYKIPNITLSPGDSKPIGRWGFVRRDYLQHNKSVQFNIMLMTGTLTSHLAEIDSQAEEMFSRLVEQMANAEGITEQLNRNRKRRINICIISRARTPNYGSLAFWILYFRLISTKKHSIISFIHLEK